MRLLRLEHGTITYFDRRQRLKGKIVLYPHTSVSRHPDIGPYRNLVHIFTAKEKGLIFSLESFDLKELWMAALVAQITAFNQQQQQQLDEQVTATKAPESSSRSLFVVSPKRLARSRADGRRPEVAETTGPVSVEVTIEYPAVDAMDLPRVSMLRDDIKDVHQVYDSIAYLESDEEDSIIDGEEGDSDAFPDAPPCPEEVDSFIRKTIISNIDQDCYRFGQESSLAIDEEPTAGEGEAAIIAISSDAVESGAQVPESDWLEACTEDGKVYFYHRITRLTRWVKPDSHIEQASELRIREAEEVLERHILDRKLELQQLQLKTAAYERIREENMSDIMLRLREWSTRTDKQGNICPLQFPELLRDLMLILPTDLLLVVYTASNNVTVKTVLHDVRTFTISTDPREVLLATVDSVVRYSASPFGTCCCANLQVKKAYMKAMRFLHPDKLPSDIDVTSKLLVEQLFILLTESYDAFRTAHDI